MTHPQQGLAHAAPAQPARSALLALAVLACVTAAARAQIPGLGGPAERPSLTLTIGFSGNYVAERINPITLTIDHPLPTPTAGTIILTLPQDSTQAADIALRYATTPGTPTTIDFFAAVPQSLQTIQATVIPDRGRRFATTFTQTPGRRDNMLMAQPVGNRPLVVMIGRSFFDAAASEWRRRARADSGVVSDPPAYVNIPPEFAPRDSHAYDAATLVIVDAAEQLPPATRDALAEHLIAGGRVALIATDPAAAIEPWIAGLPAPVLLGPPQTRAPPPALASIATIRTHAAADPAFNSASRRDQPSPGTVPIDPPGSIEIPLAPSIVARPITPIDPVWTTRWRWDEEQAQPGTPAPRTSEARTSEASASEMGPEALVATGPVGFGTLTVIATPLDRVPAVLSAQHTAAIAAVALEQLFVHRGENYNRWYTRSGATFAEAEAISTVGDFLSRGTTISLGFVPILIIAALALALLVGPVDYLLLGALKRRHRSWLTALAWIGIASVLAATAPRLIRSGTTNAVALRVVDHTEGIACATDLTLISSNDDARVSLPALPGTTRGVSPVPNFNDARPSLPALALTPIADTETRARSLALRSAVRSPLWTARLLLTDEPPAPSDQRPTLDFTADPPVLRIPEIDARQGEVVLHTGDSHVDYDGQRYQLTQAPTGYTLRRSGYPPALHTRDTVAQSFTAPKGRRTPTDAAAALPGALTRNSAIADRLQARTHALVTITYLEEITGGSLAAAADTTPLPMQRTTIHRMLVPVDLPPAENETPEQATP